MIKYVITTGKSVLAEITENGYIISRNQEDVMFFDSIGDAMSVAASLNFITNGNYKVENTSVSSNL